MIPNAVILNRINEVGLEVALRNLDVERIEDINTKMMIRTYLYSKERIPEYLSEEVTGIVKDDSTTNMLADVGSLKLKNDSNGMIELDADGNPINDSTPPDDGPRYA